ncbi:MAG: PAS domain S-box protein [Ginsengibacter sp.]
MTSPREENFYTIFNEISDCIVIMDAMGYLMDVNVSLCRLLGYTRQELLNINIAELITPKQLKIDSVAYKSIDNSEHIITERQLKKKMDPS